MKHLILAMFTLFTIILFIGSAINVNRMDSAVIEEPITRQRYIYLGPTDPCIDGHPWLNDELNCVRCGKSVEPRYGFSDDDIYMLAQLLCGSKEVEGDGEYDFVWQTLYTETNYYEITKVLCVVMNRVRDPQFPDTVYDVLMQPGQFQDMPKRIYQTPHDIAIEKVSDWCKAYDQYQFSVQSIPEDHMYFCAGPNLTNITRKDYK